MVVLISPLTNTTENKSLSIYILGKLRTCPSPYSLPSRINHTNNQWENSKLTSSGPVQTLYELLLLLFLRPYRFPFPNCKIFYGVLFNSLPESNITPALGHSIQLEHPICKSAIGLIRFHAISNQNQHPPLSPPTNNTEQMRYNYVPLDSA